MKTTRGLSIGDEVEYRPSLAGPTIFFGTVIGTTDTYLKLQFHDDEPHVDYSYDHDIDACFITPVGPNPYDLNEI